MTRLPRSLAACLLLSPFAGEAAAACPEDVSWPEPDWPVELLGDSPARRAFEDYLFTLEGPDEERRGIRSDGVVVVHRGRIVFERYARGYAADNPHLTWSVSKSFENALVGVAVERGYIGLEDPVCAYYPLDEGDPWACEMSVDELLSMGSGFDWNEGYENDPYHLSSVIAMLYGVGSGDMAGFVAGHEIIHEPGSFWRYSSGDSVLLAATLEGALPAGLEASHPWDFLFDPIGMQSAVFERDRGGTFVGSSYVYATPRDMARFGYLFLRDGCWAGERILPEGWVDLSTTPSPAFVDDRDPRWQPGVDEVPGRHWWLNAELPGQMIERAWPGVPTDAYAASGHWGQSIIVIPSADLVLVRTADDREADVVDRNRHIELALALAAEDSP